MAYLIERYCFGAEERINEFPYNACEMVCRQIYPEFLNHPEYLVAICELALMHEHSGIQFYLTLKHLKETMIDFSNINDLKHYLDNTMSEFIRKQGTINQMLIENIDFMFPIHVSDIKMANEYIKKLGYDVTLEKEKVDQVKVPSPSTQSMQKDIVNIWKAFLPMLADY